METVLQQYILQKKNININNIEKLLKINDIKKNKFLCC